MNKKKYTRMLNKKDDNMDLIRDKSEVYFILSKVKSEMKN